MKKSYLGIILACFFLAASGALVYRNAFSGPFVFDDLPQILQNDKIHSLEWPWRFLENNRRPMLYASLAWDFERYGYNAFGFHAFNIRVHILAAIFLFLLIQKTLSLVPRLARKTKFSQNSSWSPTLLAFAVAVLWLVHPLHTQAVTYIIQRAESMMGLLFLMTMYFSAQYMTTKQSFWLGIAGLTAMLCGLTKEVALALPLVVGLYDRAFISPSFKQALKNHKWLYVILAMTWVIMGYLYFTTTPERKLTAGFGMHNMSPWQYAVNQPRVILHYLRLVIWPDPLIFDYQWPVIENIAELWPSVVTILIAMVGFGFCLTFYPPISFLGLSFFLILAPSSSFIPLQDLIFEYRMYLSLSCLLIAFVFFMKILCERFLHRKNQLVGFCVVIALLAMCWGGVTYQRNKVYYNEATLWMDVIKKQPNNARAYNNLGEYLLRQGHDEDAKQCFLQSLALNDRYADVFANMATVLAKEKKLEEAIEYSKKAIAVDPDFAVGYNNLGSALSQLHRYSEAVPYFEKTLALGFYEPGVLQNLGVALVNSGHTKEALGALRESLSLDPKNQETRAIIAEIVQRQSVQNVSPVSRPAEKRTLGQ